MYKTEIEFAKDAGKTHVKCECLPEMKEEHQTSGQIVDDEFWRNGICKLSMSSCKGPPGIMQAYSISM